MKHLAPRKVGGVSISLIVVMCITQIPGALAITDSWPMFQHDRQHTGRSLQIGPHTTTLRWNFPTSGVPSSPAVSGDGTIYLPVGMLNTDTAGYLYAINPDGTQKWRPPLGGLSLQSR